MTGRKSETTNTSFNIGTNWWLQLADFKSKTYKKMVISVFLFYDRKFYEDHKLDTEHFQNIVAIITGIIGCNKCSQVQNIWNM